MPDFAPATILIGGDVTRAQLDALLANIKSAGYDMERHDGSNGPFTTVEALLEDIDSNNHLHFHESQAPNGALEELETFLRKNGFAYNRYSDASDGFTPCVNFYRVGFKEDVDLPTDDTGEPIIPAAAAIQAYEALKVGNVHEALEVLAPCQRYYVPPLPPLNVIDGGT